MNPQNSLLKVTLGYGILILIENSTIHGAVAPPPWANPKLNPCASQPRGWQLLYWPPDGKCYKIFQMGYPCPDDMELSPAATSAGVQEFSAECRCPPKTAQSAQDGHCYELFTLGPCEKGYYFGPDTQYSTNSTSRRHWGVCKQVQRCRNINELFWPQTGQCYEKLTKGPCSKGQLLTLGNDKLAACKCNHKRDMSEYFYKDYGCFQHFTKGPCKENGHLFLPDRSCGCHDELPHYHEETQQCFEIGSIGPCSTGEQFQMDYIKHSAMCLCKTGYIRYETDSTCYRPYTQGPCPTGEILVNATTCIKQPCTRGNLYFPNRQKCYRIGTTGPCPAGQVVSFDFEVRPSVDGISYNGLCNCDKNRNCNKPAASICNMRNDMVLFRNKCYKIYSQGPCSKGAWLAPPRHRKEEIWTEERRREGICECMPGYTKTLRTVKDKLIVECLSPTVILADYLNRNYVSFNKSDV